MELPDGNDNDTWPLQSENVGSGSECFPGRYFVQSQASSWSQFDHATGVNQGDYGFPQALMHQLHYLPNQDTPARLPTELETAHSWALMSHSVFDPLDWSNIQSNIISPLGQSVPTTGSNSTLPFNAQAGPNYLSPNLNDGDSSLFTPSGGHDDQYSTPLFGQSTTFNHFSSDDLGSFAGYETISPILESSNSEPGAGRERQVSPASFGSDASGESYPPRSRKKDRKPAKVSYKNILNNGSGSPKSAKVVGRRKRPYTPGQKRQASEVRKAWRCLRCRFLNKTCDKGDPCIGCQVRRTQEMPVPCTRLGIGDLGHFLKVWDHDWEYLKRCILPTHTIVGFSQHEYLIRVGHGYDLVFPLMVRHVYVTGQDNTFNQEESSERPSSTLPKVVADKLDVSSEGLRTEVLDEYVEKHVDFFSPKFVVGEFKSIPFIAETLEMIYGFYSTNKSPAVRKALKLVVAYSLSKKATVMERESLSESHDRQADTNDSFPPGYTIAPALIDLSIKHALDSMWRDLHKDILEKLAHLYDEAYRGDRLQDPMAATKICEEMELTSAGVVIGLFQSTSQKLPDFKKWESLHIHLLNDDPNADRAMLKMRENVLKYEAYLLTRRDAKFDRDNPHCLSNRLLSQLVLRNNQAPA